MIQIPVVTVTSGYGMAPIIKDATELHLGFKCVKTVDEIHINDKLMSYNVYFDKVDEIHSSTIKEFVKEISNKLTIKYENCKFNMMAQYYNF
jgi:hypothetical protein